MVIYKIFNYFSPENKSEDKSDDFPPSKKNDYNNYDKFSFRFNNNVAGSIDKNALYTEMDKDLKAVREKDKDKDSTNSNVKDASEKTMNSHINQLDAKNKVSSIRSQLNNFNNNNTINNVISNGKGEGIYKFTSLKESVNTII